MGSLRMNSSVTPLPEEHEGGSTSQQEACLRAAAQALLEAVSQEPVPDHLRSLAAELGRALDQQRAAREPAAPTDEISDNSPIG